MALSSKTQIVCASAFFTLALHSPLQVRSIKLSVFKGYRLFSPIRKSNDSTLLDKGIYAFERLVKTVEEEEDRALSTLSERRTTLLNIYSPSNPDYREAQGWMMDSRDIHPAYANKVFEKQSNSLKKDEDRALRIYEDKIEYLMSLVDTSSIRYLWRKAKKGNNARAQKKIKAACVRLSKVFPKSKMESELNQILDESNETDLEGTVDLDYIDDYAEQVLRGNAVY